MCDTSEDSSGEDAQRFSPYIFKAANTARSGSGTSSDPPYFSEDDLENASVTNYDTRRYKAKVRDSWWKHSDLSVGPARDARKPAKRTKDSGIFVSSDSDDDRNLAAIAKRNEKSAKPMFPAQGRFSTGQKRRLIEDLEHRPTTPHELLCRAVSYCLEYEQDTLDLSRMGLQVIPNSLLRPMRDLVIPPRYHTGAYTSFKPQLKLFAAFNDLQEVPSEMIKLTDLHTLSLRHNNIRELPQNIHHLKNLKSLNISVNAIRFLPWSMLRLMNTTNGFTLIATGNPYLNCMKPAPGTCRFDCEFEDVDAAIMQTENGAGVLSSTPDSEVPHSVLRQRYVLDIYTFRQARCQELTANGLSREFAQQCSRAEPVYLGSSLVTFYDANCNVPRECEAPSWRTGAREESRQPLLIAAGDPCVHRPLSTQRITPAQRVRQRIPTLFEMCTRVASRSKDFDTEDDYAFHQLVESMPDTCIDASMEARRAADAGGYSCSVCDRDYVIARAEWIEYWFTSDSSKDTPIRDWQTLFVPFLRRACSWACAEQAQEDNRAYWRRYATQGSRMEVRAASGQE